MQNYFLPGNEWLPGNLHDEATETSPTSVFIPTNSFTGSATSRCDELVIIARWIFSALSFSFSFLCDLSTKEAVVIEIGGQPPLLRIQAT